MQDALVVADDSGVPIVRTAPLVRKDSKKLRDCVPLCVAEDTDIPVVVGRTLIHRTTARCFGRNLGWESLRVQASQILTCVGRHDDISHDP